MPNPKPEMRANFAELGEYGKKPAREIRALEQHTKEAFKRVEGFTNNVLVEAVHAIGNRSMLSVQPVKAKDFQALGGFSVVPVNLVDTSAPRAVTLPQRQPNLMCIVKDATGTASAQPITVNTAEALANIDGSPSGDVIDVDFACRWYVCDTDGNDWWKVAG